MLFGHERNSPPHINKSFFLPIAFQGRIFDSHYVPRTSARFRVWFRFKFLIPDMAFWLLDPPINLPGLSHDAG